MNKKTILIVDDEEDWVKLLASRLARHGYQIEIAFDAVQATALAIKLVPDLILLDIMLPAGGGLGVLKNIRSANGSPKTINTPVIIITGRSMDNQMLETAKQLRVAGYLQKPMEMDELLRQIKRALGENIKPDVS